MGSIFGKRSRKYTPGNYENVKGMHAGGSDRAHNIGSTHSLNADHGEVSLSPHLDPRPGLEQPQHLTRHQSLEDFRGPSGPTLPPRVERPSVPGHKAESRKKDEDEYEDDNLPALNKNQEVMEKKDMKDKKKATANYAPLELDSRPKVRADSNYEANYGSDISFRKGDILQLINEGCFFKGLDREEAEEKLLEPGIEIGTYLLRPNETDDYALSLRCKDESGDLQVSHYKVRVVDKGICYIDADSKSKPFSNITELIKYYTEKPGLRCKLKMPLPQDVPLEDLAVKFSDLKFGEKLGSGNFGSVYAGTLCSNTQTLEEIKTEAEAMPSILSGEPDDWFLVRNLKTREEGYVHKTWISMITSSDVESQTCFFKTVDREEAVKKLLEPGIELGTYLIRPSGDDYALSLRCKNELYELEIRHYKIRINDKGVCYIDADSNSKTFSNIVELIKFYSEKPGLHCKLKKQLPQETPLNDVVVKFSDFNLGEKLGSGNFGSVNAGTLHNNRQVAVKSLKAGGSMTVQEFRQEAETMHKLRHPNLVSLLAICEGNDKIYIITERMSKGAMLNLLRNDTDHTITFKDLMHMAIQVVEGMCYLEKKGFVHRDLRAANVLVGDGNITKIADFGLARILDDYYEHEDFYREQKGGLLPYKWTAPEAIKQLKFTVKSDVWSFGILLYEMVTYGDEPYAGMSNLEVIDWVDNGNRLKRPTGHCPLVLYNIMRQCWIKNSNERPNFVDIKETLFEIQTNE